MVNNKIISRFNLSQSISWKNNEVDTNLLGVTWSIKQKETDFEEKR